LSGIFLQEGFPTSGNDIQVALLMTVLVNHFVPLDQKGLGNCLNGIKYDKLTVIPA